MIIYYMIIAVVFLLDQLSKYIIKVNYEIYEQTSVIKNFFYITYVENTGAAWSIFQGGRWIFVAITSVMLVAIFIYIHKVKNSLLRTCCAMIIGGGLGNLIDRVIYGSVVDFIDLRFWSYDFPVFNVSDSFVTIGSILLGIYIIRLESKKKV